MPLSRKDIERMSEVQRAETSCRLSLFPTLSNREIGQYMGGYSINSVEKFIQAGRAMGLESSSDRYPADAQPTRPSPEEMDWRFANQDAKQFCTRFNGKSMPKAQTVILDLDLEAKLPDPWRAAIFGTKPSSPPLAPATRPLRRKVEEVGDDEGEAKVIGRVAILDTDIAIGGGAENMSRGPYASLATRFGARMGDSKMIDMVVGALHDPFHTIHMGVTAENVAAKYGITRDMQDALAVESHNRAQRAIEGGLFKDQIVPVMLKSRKGEVAYDTDEHYRPNCTLADMAKLKPVFVKENGTVTAGNASGINDAAAAVASR